MHPYKQDVLTYLSEVRSHFAAYHNHKETSAWVAAALYLAGVLQVVGTMGANAGFLDKGFRFLVIIVFGVAIFIYIWFQFQRREEAANVVAACFALRTEYLTAELPPDENLFKLDDISAANSHTPLILAKIVSAKMRHYSTRGHFTRIVLEWSMYVSLVAIAGGGLAVIILRT